jgi:hypothetical protein
VPGRRNRDREVHGYQERTVADVPTDGRQVLVAARLRWALAASLAPSWA